MVKTPEVIKTILRYVCSYWHDFYYSSKIVCQGTFVYCSTWYSQFSCLFVCRFKKLLFSWLSQSCDWLSNVFDSAIISAKLKLLHFQRWLSRYLWISFMVENLLKWRTDSWWRPQCGLKTSSIYLRSSSFICSSDVYRQQSGWCRYLSSILTHFLACNLSRFSFYINEFLLYYLFIYLWVFIVYLFIL